MRTLLRAARIVMSVALACTAGTLPACGSMGGGMKYFTDPPAFTTT